MKSLVFCCLLSACAVMNGAEKPTIPPSAPPAAAQPAPRPRRKPPTQSVKLDLPDDAIPDGWARLVPEPSRPGELVAEFGHFPEHGYIRASVIDGEMREVDAAEMLAAQIVADGGRVSPVDHMDGTGKYATFNVLVDKDGVRELHRFLFRATGRGSSTLFIIGIWPHAANTAMRKDFEAIAAALTVS